MRCLCKFLCCIEPLVASNTYLYQPTRQARPFMVANLLVAFDLVVHGLRCDEASFRKNTSHVRVSVTVCLLPHRRATELSCPTISRQSQAGSRAFQLTGKNLLKPLPRSTRSDSSQALPRYVLSTRCGRCLRLCIDLVTVWRAVFWQGFLSACG